MEISAEATLLVLDSSHEPRTYIQSDVESLQLDIIDIQYIFLTLWRLCMDHL